MHSPSDIDLLHSPNHGPGTQSQVISLDINSGRTQKQNQSSCSKTLVPMHKVPRKRQRNETAAGLGERPESNQDVCHGYAGGLCKATNDEKVLLGSTVCHPSEIQGAGRDSNDLLHDLDELVQKWKAEMQQVDVGKGANGASAVDQNHEAAPDSADVFSIPQKAAITVSKERKETDEKLGPDIAYTPEVLEKRSNTIVEHFGDSFEEAEVVRVELNTTQPIIQHGPDVSDPPRSVRQPPLSRTAKLYTQPGVILQPLGMMVAPMQSIYEQQMKDYETPLAKEVDFSTPPTWERDTLSRSAFCSHMGIYPVNTNTYRSDRHPLRFITSVNSNIDSIAGEMKLLKDPIFYNKNTRLTCPSLHESPGDIELYPMNHAMWDYTIKRDLLTTPQVRLTDLKDSYILSDIMSEQSRSRGYNDSHSHTQQDYHPQSTDLRTEEGPRNFWTPQKLY